ncbi:4Fe-4S binding protein, partial [Faecalispora jeddahensis]|uniref:4Fe-4S binding protein n=1 Tax=Faecalispora jeddahensis TaxID=1414721 RepID=UPI0028B027CC
ALYISTFSGVKQIYLSIIHQNFNITTLLPQIVEALAIIPVTAFLGRFFCGWMCAFGAMGDLISMLSLKLFKRKFRISERLDRMLKYLKYILLVFLVIAVWTFGINTFSTASPWDAFGMLTVVGQALDFGYVASHLAPALAILALIVLASFFVERFFCRYLCPLGAIFAIASKLRVTSIRKPKAKCGNCRACTRSCPMGIALYKKDTVRSGECIHCFSCVSACPRRNVTLAVSDSDVRPALASAMAVAAMTGIYYA